MDVENHLDRPPQFRAQLAGPIPQQPAAQLVPPQVTKKAASVPTSAQGGNGDNGNESKSRRIPDKLKRVIKVTSVLIAVLVAVLILILAATLTSVDTLIIKSSLSGRVQTVEGGAVPGATVRLAGEAVSGDNIELSANTDISGNYFIGNLELGGYELSVEAEGFEPYSQRIAINRTFLDYNNDLNIELQPSGEGFIVGRFMVEDVASYNFINDTLSVNGQNYQVLADGSFSIPDLTTGNNDFRFSSENYTDVLRNIDLNPGENDLGEIKLTPSGDIVGSLKSYVREDIVKNLQITVEGLPQDQVEIDESAGDFRIRDLEIGREYRISISHPNYVDREYLQKAERGEVSLFGLRLVEDGAVVYLKEDDRDIEIFSSEYDGGEEKQLTDNRLEPYAEYLDSAGTVFFLSTRDSVSSKLGGGRAFLVYAVPVDGGNPQRVTTNTQDLGQVYPNFKAKRLVHITSLTRERKDRRLEAMDLRGANRKTLFELTTGEINDLTISDDGRYVAFAVLTGETSVDGLYRANIETGESVRLTTKQPVQIFDITPNGNGVLYSYFNESTQLNDLYLFEADSGQDKKVRGSFTGQQYQFVDGSSSELIYFATEQERSNLYNLTLDNNQVKRLTSFTGTEGVEAIYQQNGFILYQTNRGLYIMDFEKPHPGKLVTREFARYTGIDY